jgi:hypothetical protein
MSRLADSIQDDYGTSLGRVYRSLPFYEGSRVVPQEDVPDDLPVYVVDEICEQLYAGVRQERWDLRTDFPHCLPRETDAFIEMKRPTCIRSEAFGTQSALGLPVRWGWFIARRPQREEAIRRNATLATRACARLLATEGDQIDLEKVSRVIEAQNPVAAGYELNATERQFMTALHLSTFREWPGDPTLASSHRGSQGWVLNARPVYVVNGKVEPSTTTIELHLDGGGTIVREPIFTCRSSHQIGLSEQNYLIRSNLSLLYPALAALSMINREWAVVSLRVPTRIEQIRRERRGRPRWLPYRWVSIKPGCSL